MPGPRKPSSPQPDCGCPYRWGNHGRLYGISMGEGWIRTDTNPECPEHGVEADAAREVRRLEGEAKGWQY